MLQANFMFLEKSQEYLLVGLALISTFSVPVQLHIRIINYVKEL